MRPETHLAKCDGIAVAYQTFGNGPDLVICPGRAMTWEDAVALAGA